MSANQKNVPGLVAAAWIFVSIPLGWGIYNTALASAKLFTRPALPVVTQTTTL